jgi:plastocyanin
LLNVQANASALPIEIDTTAFEFAPKTIEIPAGATVRLTFRNRGWGMHDLQIDGVEDAHVQARPDQVTHLTFNAPPPGTYRYWCTLPGHAEAGMVGKLVVVPPLNQPAPAVQQSSLDPGGGPDSEPASQP